MSDLALSIPGLGGTPAIEIQAPQGIPSGGFVPKGQQIFQTGLSLLLIATLVLSLLSLIFGGIEWITSAGSKEKLQKARNRIIYSILGLVVTFLSFLIINLIGYFFGVALLGE